MKCLSITAVACALLLACAPMSGAHADSQTAMAALKGFYASTNGAGWTNKAGWTAATGPCTTPGGWYGVTCDGNTDASNIIRLEVGANNLVGNLSVSLGDLGSSLQLLNVSSNPFLGGNIDESFGNLVGLVDLYMSDCFFSRLPTGLSKLTKLSIIDVSNNKILGGALDPAWSAWGTSVTVVNLGHNFFTGELPTEWSAWTNLVSLNLEQNILIGALGHGLPASWSAMTALTVLDIHNCASLIGTLPNSWSAMTKLVEFRLNNTKMSGDLPESWNTMVEMKYFEATSCQFTGQIPHSWFHNWTKLQVFDMYANSLFSDLPATIQSSKLTYFNVAGNLMTGALPEMTMGNLPGAAGPTDCVVDFSHNAFSGVIPDTWGTSLKCVTTLNLDHNLFLSGPLPDSLSLMPMLKELYIYETKIQSQLPATWATRWQRLEVLVLQGNTQLKGNIIGTLPTVWGLPNLKLLDLSFNDLEGAIPEMLLDHVRMPALQSINLMENKLTSVSLAVLPPGLQILALNDNLLESDISAMVAPSTLAFCYLYNNRFYGALPQGLKGATDLVDLRFQNNYFEGPVPTSWYHAKVNHVYMYNNRLSGPVPVQYLYSKGLQSLLVGQNNFNGTLLTSLAPGLAFNGGKTPNIWLNFFNVSYNQIEGNLPSEWSSDTPFLYTFDVSHNKLSGTLPNYVNTTADALHLNHNQLIGSIPANWSLMSHTRGIDLGHNSLTGDLPEWISNFTSLEWLSLAFNEFKGSLPKNWPQKMVNLENLRLTGNSIESTIPDSYGTFPKLIRLELGLNRLYGELPFQGPNQKPSKTLNHLFLSSNYFSGTLPAIWGVNLPAIAFLNVASNRLEGPLPNEWKDWKSLLVLNVEANFRINGTLPSSWGHENATLTGFSGAFCDFIGPFPESWVDNMPLNGLNLQGLRIGGIPNKAFPSLGWLSLDYMTFEDGGFPDKAINSLFMRECTMRRCGIQAPLPSFSAIKLEVLDLSENAWTGSMLPYHTVVNGTTHYEPIEWDSMSYLGMTPTTASANPAALAHNIYTYFDREHKLYQVGGFTYRNPGAVQGSKSEVTGLMPISIMPFQFVNYAMFPAPAFSFLSEVNGFGMTDFKEKFLTPNIVLQYRATMSPFHPSDVMGPFPWGEWQTVDGLPNSLLILDKMQYNALFGTAYTLSVSFKVTYTIDGSVQEFTVSSLPMHRDPCTPTTFAVNGTHECMSCPAGGICDGFAAIKSAGDVWRPYDSFLPLLTCDPNLQGCATAGQPTTSCKEGYDGFMCANCDESVGFFKASRGCDQCNQGFSTVGKIVMSFVCVAFTIVLAYLVAPTADGIRASRREMVLSLFKFCFNFLAMMGLICYTDAAKRMAEVGWGILDLEGFLSGATFFNQLYWACGFDTYNGYTQLIWACMTFIFLLAFTIIPVMKNGLARPSSHSLWFYAVAGVASTLHLSYNALVATAFRMMDVCEYTTFTNAAYLAEGSVDYRIPGYGSQVTKNTLKYGWLHSDPSISCSGGGSRAEYFIDGFMAFFFLCGLLPVLLWAAHRRIQSTVDDDTATNVFYYFSLNYRTDTWYWEYVLFVRKVMIVAIVAFAPKYAQLTLLAALFGLNLYMNERFRPFASDRLASADSLTIACAFATVSIMSFALSAEGNTTGDAVMVMLVQLATWGGLGFLIFKYVTGDDTVSVGSKYGGLASGERLDTGFTASGGSMSRSPPVAREESELKSVSHMRDEPESGGYGGVN